MNKLKGVVLAAVFVLSTMLIPFSVSADTNIIIDGNKLPAFKDRTKAAIFEKWTTGEIANYDSIYETGKEASFTNPYSGGTVKMEVLRDIQDNLNYYRWLCGCSPITSDPVQRQDLQNASVLQQINLQDRENGVGLTHTLWDYPKPADMSQEFYESAVYANHNIISTYSYKNAVRGFFGESLWDRYGTIGHRLALLYPTVSRVDFGLGGATYGEFFTTSPSDISYMDSFAAYPAPGYFPKQDFASGSDWDIYLNSFCFESCNSESVTAQITNLNTGEITQYSKTNGNISASGRSIILKAPEKAGDIYSYYNGTYLVEVAGLKDLSGNSVSLRYTVNFYDKFESQHSEIKEMFFDGGSKDVLTIDSSNRNDAIARIQNELPKNIDVRLQNGSYSILPISGWEYSDLQYSYFPGASYKMKCYPRFEPNDIPSNIDNPEALTSFYFTVMFFDEGESVYTGDVGKRISAATGDTVSITITDTSSPKLYQWYKQDPDGNITKIESSNKYRIEQNVLTITGADISDCGKYFISTDADNWANFFYISGTVTLDIDGAYFLPGDVDESGSVTTLDALTILQAAVRKITLNERQQKIADLNGDQRITTTDALAALQIAVGKRI